MTILTQLPTIPRDKAIEILRSKGYIETVAVGSTDYCFLVNNKGITQGVIETPHKFNVRLDVRSSRYYLRD